MASVRPIVVLDLDGTLLSSKLEIGPKNLEAVRRAAVTGATIVLASGRSLGSMRKHASALGCCSHAICCNGAATVDLDTDVIVFENSLNEEVITRVLTNVQ